MDPIDNHGVNTFNERVTIDFQYFIESAVQKKLAWNTLAYFLTDLAPTLDKSRQIIRILVQELEKWVLKVDTKEDSIVMENVTEKLNKELALHFQDEDQNSLASSEMSDSEDESIKDTIEVTNDDQEIVVDKIEHDLNLLEKKEILGEEDVLVDKVGRQFYEFVGDHNKDIKEYDIPKKVAHIVSTDEIENNDDALKQIESDDKDIEEIGDEEFVINVEDNIGDHSYEFVGEPEETQENHKISKEEEIILMGAGEKVSLDELTESKFSNLFHEEKKKFNCSVCDKAISRKQDLVRHERIHTGQKPYRCNDCEKSFTLQNAMKRHVMLHKTERPYKCKTCSKSFALNALLQRHEIIHKGGRPFQCHTCKKHFNQRDSLKRHEITIHKGEKPHKCFTCNKSFGYKYHLNSHLKTHTGEKPFQCKHCEKSFSRSDALKRHERKHT